MQVPSALTTYFIDATNLYARRVRDALLGLAESQLNLLSSALPSHALQVQLFNALMLLSDAHSTFLFTKNTFHPGTLKCPEDSFVTRYHVQALRLCRDSDFNSLLTCLK